MTIHEAAEKLFTECFPEPTKKECAFRMIAENAYAWDSGLLHWECVQIGVMAVMHSYFNPDRSEPALRRAYRMDADSLTEIPPEKLARLLPGSVPAVEQDPAQPDSETETLRALRTEKEAETKALQAQRWKEWEKKRKEEVREYHREYERSEKTKEKRRKYREKHREEIREKNRRYYEANREKYREYQRMRYRQKKAEKAGG